MVRSKPRFRGVAATAIAVGRRGLAALASSVLFATTAPGADVTTTTIKVYWTAPGDDGYAGTATEYDLRYTADSVAGITEATWDLASRATGEPAPQPAGSDESFTITNLSPATTYFIALKTRDEANNWSPLSNVLVVKTAGLGLGIGDSTSLPNRYELAQNYPNPFNPATVIEWTLPTPVPVSIAVYNVSGQLVRRLVEGSFPAGMHAVLWDGTLANGTPVASGVYFYRIDAGGFSDTRKMTLLR